MHQFQKSQLRIRGARFSTNPSGICILKSTGSEYNRAFKDPYPAVLFTCRTIAAEATPILYRENSLQFHFEATDPDEPTPSARSIRKLCTKLFNYSSDSWSTRVALAFRSSDFAIFLNIIGPINAASITSLSFYGPDADCVADCVPTVTELVAHHLPCLQSLKIYVGEADIHWDESPDYVHPNRASPFWANGDFWPLYRALQGFIERVEWLREFEYEGQEHFCEFYSEMEGWHQLKGLEEVVKSRTEVQARADNSMEVGHRR